MKLNTFCLNVLLIFLSFSDLAIGQTCKPTWDRTKSSNVVCAPIQFLANSPGKNTYDWDFGSGFFGPGTGSMYRDPVHAFSKAGLNVIRYKFSLNNVNACFDTIMIFIKENPKVFYHQLFSNAQNFEGNKFCFVVDSIKTLDSAQICNLKFILSDGATYPILKPKGGDTICHTFSDPAGGYFNLTIESLICNKCLSITEIDSIVRVFPKSGFISTASLNSQLSIFPNPTKDFLEIHLVKSSRIFLYSLDGLLLFLEDYKAGKSSLDLSRLSNASYLLVVFDGSSYYKQIIQKH